MDKIKETIINSVIEKLTAEYEKEYDDVLNNVVYERKSFLEIFESDNNSFIQFEEHFLKELECLKQLMIKTYSIEDLSFDVIYQFNNLLLNYFGLKTNVEVLDWLLKNHSGYMVEIINWAVVSENFMNVKVYLDKDFQDFTNRYSYFIIKYTEREKEILIKLLKEAKKLSRILTIIKFLEKSDFLKVYKKILYANFETHHSITENIEIIEITIKDLINQFVY